MVPPKGSPFKAHLPRKLPSISILSSHNPVATSHPALTATRTSWRKRNMTFNSKISSFLTSSYLKHKTIEETGKECYDKHW